MERIIAAGHVANAVRDDKKSVAKRWPAGRAAGLVALAKTPAAASPLNRPPRPSPRLGPHRSPSDQSAPRWRR